MTKSIIVVLVIIIVSIGGFGEKFKPKDKRDYPSTIQSAKNRCRSQLENYQEDRSVFGKVPDVDPPYEWINSRFYSFKKKRRSENEVLQGQLGDCWLVTVISRLALESLSDEVTTIETTQTHPNAYGLVLYPEGNPTCIVVDTNVPFNSDKHLFAHSPMNGENKMGQQLTSLLEKAAAKQYLGYRALDQGSISEGFFLLTGRTCRIYAVCQDDVPRISNANFCLKNANEMVENILQEDKKQSILFLNKKNDPNDITIPMKNDLVLGHTYAIIKVFPHIRYLTIYDTSRKTNYIVISPKRFTEFEHVFPMEISQVPENFEEFYACESKKEGTWNDRESGIFPHSFQDSDNIKAFEFVVTQHGESQLLLLQKNIRRLPKDKKDLAETKYRYPVVLVIFKKTDSKYIYYTSSCFADLFYNIINREFEPETYLAIPFALSQMTDKFNRYYGEIFPGFDPEYSLLIKSKLEKLKFTDVKVTKEEYWIYFMDYLIATRLQKVVICAEGSTVINEPCQGGYLNFYIKKGFGIWVFILHNINDFSVSIKTKLTAKTKEGKDVTKDVIFGRDNNEVTDTIPPKTIYVVNFIWDIKDIVKQVDDEFQGDKQKIGDLEADEKNFVLFRVGENYIAPNRIEENSLSLACALRRT